MIDYKYRFPFFDIYKGWSYFDSAATTLKPDVLIDVIEKELIGIDIYDNINLHKEAARRKVAHLLNGEIEEIIFTSSATMALNQLAQGLKHLLNKDDEILTTIFEHDANYSPWVNLISEKQIKIKTIKTDINGLIDLDYLKKMINDKTKIITYASMSNTIASFNNLAKINGTIKKINPNVIIIIDAAQSIAHYEHNVKKENADFLVFSAHKFYGPYHMGIIWGKINQLKKIKPLLFGAYMNNKIDSNFKPIELNIKLPFLLEALPIKSTTIKSFNASLDFVFDIGIKTIFKNNKNLKIHARKQIKKYNLEKDYFFYNLNNDSGILLLNHKTKSNTTIAKTLKSKHKMIVRVGEFAAWRVKEALKTNKFIRISFGIYNTKQDIDKLILVLKQLG